MKVFSITDTGITREMNQDFYFASETDVGNLPNLYIVADGMGGHKAGDYASRYTIERVVASVSRCPGGEPVEILKEAIAKANELLIQDSNNDNDKHGMGTTLVACTIFEDSMIVANIGDSRLYVANDKLLQITRDHSLVEEMVRLGEMDEEAAREHPKKNIITRAIGAAETVEPDFFEVSLQNGDEVLLCTDGLTNMVKDEEILQIIQKNTNIEKQAELLMNTANNNGGMDNITVMLIQPFSNEVKE